MLDSAGRFLLSTLLAVLVAVTAGGLWQAKTESDGPTHLGTADDITYDPIANPGQAAKDR